MCRNKVVTLVNVDNPVNNCDIGHNSSFINNIQIKSYIEPDT